MYRQISVNIYVFYNKQTNICFCISKYNKSLTGLKLKIKGIVMIF
jgi:hypothetical protein